MKFKDYIIIFLLIIILIFSYLIYSGQKKSSFISEEKNKITEEKKQENKTHPLSGTSTPGHPSLEQSSIHLDLKKGRYNDEEKKEKKSSKLSVLDNREESPKQEKNNFGEKKENKTKKNFCDIFIEKGYYYKIWSETKPKINKTHIFCGEINSRGKPTGFHSRQNGIDPKTAKLINFGEKNKIGVYNGSVEIKDLKYGVYKKKFSTFFPDNLSDKEVLEAIKYAWEHKKFYKKEKFRGPTKYGFEIEGYTYKGDKNKINTAYPILKK